MDSYPAKSKHNYNSISNNPTILHTFPTFESTSRVNCEKKEKLVLAHLSINYLNTKSNKVYFLKLVVKVKLT